MPEVLQEVTTPLQYEEWWEVLQEHWNKALVQCILSGIQEGFRVHFDYGKASCKPAQCNLLSAETNPDVVPRCGNNLPPGGSDSGKSIINTRGAS